MSIPAPVDEASVGASEPVQLGVARTLMEAIREKLGDEAFRGIMEWLAQELEDEQYARLEQAGHKQEDRIPLARVFIDLEVSDSPMERRPGRQIGLSDSPERLLVAHLCQPRTERSAVSNWRDDDVHAERFARRHSKRAWVDGHVVVGGPGQGKSTLGQLLCQLHRAWLLRPYLDQCATDLQKQTIVAFTNDLAHKDLGCPAEPSFPVRIVLAEAAAWLATENATPTDDEIPALLRFVANRARRDKVAPHASDLAQIFRTVNWLLVLDGLDEVPGSSDRTLVIKAVEELLAFLATPKTRGLLLATTRPQGYADEFAHLGIVNMRTHYLSLLSKEQARVYAERLVATRYPADRRETVLHRLSLAAAGETTSRLMGTPLQVTILATLVDHIGRAPNERWTLFKEYYRVMYEREMERETFAADLLRDYRGYVDRIHTHVGLLLQTEAERSGGTASMMSPPRFRQIVEAVLSEDEMDGARRDVLADRLVEAARHRLVFLVEPQPDKLGFEIRSIQEYMAAWALSQKSETIVEERIRQIAKASSFRNVVIFLASKAFAELSDLRDAFTDRICPWLNEDPDDVSARITLAGSQLALEILEDGAALKQAKYVRKLVELVVKLVELPPDPIHPRLVRACLSDEEAAPIALPILQRAITTGLQSNALVQKQGAWAALLTLVEKGNAWALEVANEQWPKEPEVRGKILQLGRHAGIELSPWLIERILDAPAEFGPRDIYRVEQPDLFFLAFRMHESVKRNAIVVALSALDHLPRCMNVSWVNDHFEIPVSSVNSTQKYPARDLDVLCQMKDMPPSWTIVGAVARFVREPSANTLAEALETIAKNFEPQTINWISNTAPWPLRVCLDVAATADELLRLSQHAADGTMGTLDDWLAAEDKGIASAIPVASGLPFDRLSLARSLPLEATSGSFDTSAQSISESEIKFRRILEVFQKSSSRKLRADTADALLHAMFWDFKDGVAITSLETLQEMADEASEVPFEVLDALCPWDRPDPRWGELVDAIGRRDIVSYENYDADALRDVITNLVQLYREKPHLHGLVCILNDIADDLEPGGIPRELLAPERFSETKIQDAASLLIVKQGYLSLAEAEPLLARCIQRDGIFRVLALANMNGIDVESLLALAHNHARPDDLRTSSAILAHARHAFSDILSGLDEPSTWDRLRLPMPYPARGSTSNRPPPYAAHESAVKLQSIRLDNMRIFEQFALEPLAQPENGSGQWIVLLGENGTGKTTLLRSLVFALLDVKSQPNKLPKSSFSPKAPWRRLGIEDHETAKVRVALTDRSYQAEISIDPDRREKERLNQMLVGPTSEHHEAAYSFPFYGYGCRRGSALGGGANQSDDTPGAEVYTLFDEGANLIDAELWLLLRQNIYLENRESDAGRVYPTILAVLASILGFESIEGTQGQIWVTGPTIGQKVPLGVLSDGYLTTMGWVVDLIARWVKRAELQREKIPEQFNLHMTGLVLVDELDLHLHPAWQTRVIGDIRKAFPRMSFVVTTHHPLTLLGARAEEIWKLERNEEGAIVARLGKMLPAILTAPQILRQYFGIQRTFPNPLGDDLQRLSFLTGYRGRTEAEEQEMRELVARLQKAGADPGWVAVPRDGTHGGQES